jgi:hypothetical protein
MIVFAADKLCWPRDPHRPACWSVLDSTLADDAFGSNIIKGDMMQDRPRWLHSGAVLDPKEDIRKMVDAFMKE